MGVVAAIVIAGGASERFGSDKLALVDVEGRTLLEAVVDGLRAAGVEPVVVVGPARAGIGQVTWAREEPPGGGPCAALVAGLRALPPETEIALVLAGDAPGGARAGATLAAAVREGAAAAVLADHQGREQPITAAYRVSALRDMLAPHGDAQGLSVRLVLESMRAAGLAVAVVADDWAAAEDIDVTADAERLGYRRPTD